MASPDPLLGQNASLAACTRHTDLDRTCDDCRAFAGLAPLYDCGECAMRLSGLDMGAHKNWHARERGVRLTPKRKGY